MVMPRSAGAMYMYNNDGRFPVNGDYSEKQSRAAAIKDHF